MQEPLRLDLDLELELISEVIVGEAIGHDTAPGRQQFIGIPRLQEHFQSDLFHHGELGFVRQTDLPFTYCNEFPLSDSEDSTEPSSYEYDYDSDCSSNNNVLDSPKYVSDKKGNLQFADKILINGKKKPRLFRFLYEMLHDPEMRHCIWWVQSSNGVFQFSSKNKEMLAKIWGIRKGNRTPMTYQKMARALRNYSQTGEIIKVKRKLTYKFNEETLCSLQGGIC
ncbi:transcription factor Spi-C-like [Ambystoma mexicanum]|uniref:transcription factor Spi-C-like n=1 Tax=Ambystoma mexicanum TaxID=8296 RepID=UPI0037E856DB